MYLSISPYLYQDAFDLWKEVYYRDSQIEDLAEEEIELLFKKFDDMNGLSHIQRKKCNVEGYMFNHKEKDFFKIKNHARFAMAKIRYEALEDAEILDENQFREQKDQWQT